MQMDSESDNSTYQLSGGEEPAGLRKAKKNRSKGARNGFVSNGGHHASEDGHGGQDDGQGDAYYDAPKGEERNYQQY